MSGTRDGGLLAAETNKRKYGEDFYARIGHKGDRASHTGGFYGNRALAKLAGAKGGRISRRKGPSKFKEVSEEFYELSRAGLTAKELSMTFDISISTAYLWLRKEEEYGINQER